MGMTYRYCISYRFKEQMREHLLELDQSSLPAHIAALHLLQLHFGDAENSLIMPTADAPPVSVLDQAQLLGITDITSRLIP